MQKVKFDGQEGVSQPDIDSEGNEAELKLGCLSLHIGSSIYQVLSKLICHGDIAAAFTNLSK